MSCSHVLSTIPPVGDFDRDPVGAAMLITFQDATCESAQRKHNVLGGCFGGPKGFGMPRQALAGAVGQDQLGRLPEQYVCLWRLVWGLGRREVRCSINQIDVAIKACA